MTNIIIIICISLFYILPLICCYLTIRKWCIINGISPDGVEIFLVFCPLANIIALFIYLFDILKDDKNNYIENFSRKFFNMK